MKSYIYFEPFVQKKTIFYFDLFINSSGMAFKNNSQKEFITIVILDVYGVLAVISNENLNL